MVDVVVEVEDRGIGDGIDEGAGYPIPNEVAHANISRRRNKMMVWKLCRRRGPIVRTMRIKCDEVREVNPTESGKAGGGRARGRDHDWR
jgi:hypothetical protein